MCLNPPLTPTPTLSLAMGNGSTNTFHLVPEPPQLLSADTAARKRLSTSLRWFSYQGGALRLAERLLFPPAACAAPAVHIPATPAASSALISTSAHTSAASATSASTPAPVPTAGRADPILRERCPACFGHTEFHDVQLGTDGCFSYRHLQSAGDVNLADPEDVEEVLSGLVENAQDGAFDEEPMGLAEDGHSYAWIWWCGGLRRRHADLSRPLPEFYEKNFKWDSMAGRSRRAHLRSEEPSQRGAHSLCLR
ncbi:hypothetical protein B0H12DRAFT_1219350 [Mycena haematopus]|nr:hypothetical protein B0H12DRAFT_1219350 [Mycena haematopus]